MSSLCNDPKHIAIARSISAQLASDCDDFGEALCILVTVLANELRHLNILDQARALNATYNFIVEILAEYAADKALAEPEGDSPCN